MLVSLAQLGVKKPSLTMVLRSGIMRLLILPLYPSMVHLRIRKKQYSLLQISNGKSTILRSSSAMEISHAGSLLRMELGQSSLKLAWSITLLVADCQVLSQLISVATHLCGLKLRMPNLMCLLMARITKVISTSLSSRPSTSSALLRCLGQSTVTPKLNFSEQASQVTRSRTSISSGASFPHRPWISSSLRETLDSSPKSRDFPGFWQRRPRSLRTTAGQKTTSSTRLWMKAPRCSLLTSKRPSM